MWNTLTQHVRKAFTDAADKYDILTSLHKEIGRELVKKNLKLNAPVIIDVGCGTGYVANKAKFFYPESRVIGLDIAEGMLAQAAALHEGIAIDWVQADAAELPFKSGCVDLVLSNLAYQWAVDLNKAMADASRVLRPGGAFNITLFGQRTCYELFEALTAVDNKFKYRPIPALDDVRKAMAAADFKNIHIDFELIKVEFASIYELLQWLKNIGANNLGAGNQFLGKQMLSKAQAYCRAHFPYNQGICASFEVIWAQAKK